MSEVAREVPVGSDSAFDDDFSPRLECIGNGAFKVYPQRLCGRGLVLQFEPYRTSVLRA